jgi:hypothetical protein
MKRKSPFEGSRNLVGKETGDFWRVGVGIYLEEFLRGATGVP